MGLTVAAITKANKRRKYKDERGLFLSVSANGRKSWVFCYRFPDPSRKSGYLEREMGLGPVDESQLKLDLEKARNRVADLREQVGAGIDPLAEKGKRREATVRRKRSGSTFREVTMRLIEKKRPGWTDNGRSEEAWTNSLTNHVFDHIGDIDVADITMFHVRDLLMAPSQFSKKNPPPPLWIENNVLANRIQNRIRAVMTLAAVEKLRPDENPANLEKLLLMLPEHVHEEEPQAAMPYAELPDYLRDLREKVGIAPRALEFTILSCVRTGDTIGAKWHEIDLEKREWVIPAARMKGKKSRKKLPDHRIPLTARAIEILESLPREQGNDFVFLSRRKKGCGISNMAMLKLLQKDMKRPDCSVHGFRSTFRDWVAEETDHPDYVAEKALSHAIKSHVEAAYRRGDLFEKRRILMADWTQYCEGKIALRAVGGEPQHAA